MVVVKIEVWPRDDQSQAKQIGEMRISDNGEGTPAISDYDVSLRHGGKFWGRPGIWKNGMVKKFARSLSPYHLVFRALESCLKGK